jgi:hypothetical protein
LTISDKEAWNDALGRNRMEFGGVLESSYHITHKTIEDDVKTTNRYIQFEFELR